MNWTIVEPRLTSSLIDAMVYTRGSSTDYDRIAEYTRDPGWSWNNVQQYFQTVL